MSVKVVYNGTTHYFDNQQDASYWMMSHPGNFKVYHTDEETLEVSVYCTSYLVGLSQTLEDKLLWMTVNGKDFGRWTDQFSMDCVTCDPNAVAFLKNMFEEHLKQKEKPTFKYESWFLKSLSR